MSQPGYVHPPFVKHKMYATAQAAGDKLGWWINSMGLPEAWKTNKGFSGKLNRSVRIGICDTGVDRVHVTNGDLPNVVMRLDATGLSRDGWAKHDDHHGTACCGVAAGAENDRGMIGVAPLAELVSVKVMDGGSGYSEWIAKGIRMAVDEGEVDIVSLSLGSPGPSKQIAEAIEYAVSKGVYVFAAAGNTGRPMDINFPARWRQPPGRKNVDTIAVGAYAMVNGKLERSSFSSMGPELDISAPGSGIVTTWENGTYMELDGTSFACPATAGVAALLIARHWDLGDESKTPLTNMDQMREHLYKAATDAGKEGFDDEFGGGMLTNVGDALESDGGVQPPVEPQPQGWLQWFLKFVQVPADGRYAVGIWPLGKK